VSRRLLSSIANASLTRSTIRRKVAPTLVATPSLLYWRMERGLLQTELADMAGVHRATVARLEQGYLSRLDTIRKIAEALGVSPGDLLRDPPVR
jgi:DNA-binding Xre family transcriptional regulator